MVLATKFGIVRDPANPGLRGVSGRADYVRPCCEASLKRIGVDAIDRVAPKGAAHGQRYPEAAMGLVNG